MHKYISRSENGLVALPSQTKSVNYGSKKMSKCFWVGKVKVVHIIVWLHNYTFDTFMDDKGNRILFLQIQKEQQILQDAI